MFEQGVIEQESTLWVETVISYLVHSLGLVFVVLSQLIEKLSIIFQSVFETLISILICFLENFQTFIQSAFSEYQIRLLQLFFLILTIQIIAICIAWRVYSERITERFLRPSHLISHEQLKTAVSELKLPAEHTPRW